MVVHKVINLAILAMSDRYSFICELSDSVDDRKVKVWAVKMDGRNAYIGKTNDKEDFNQEIYIRLNMGYRPTTEEEIKDALELYREKIINGHILGREDWYPNPMILKDFLYWNPQN